MPAENEPRDRTSDRRRCETAQGRWGDTPISELPPIPIPELSDVMINPDREAEEAADAHV